MAVCASNAMQGHDKQGKEDIFMGEWVSGEILPVDTGSFAREAEHGQDAGREKR